MCNYIKIHKDILPKSTRSNVIYKLNDCDASYVGQTGRQLHIRISEHHNDIKRNTNSHSVVSEH